MTEVRFTGWKPGVRKVTLGKVLRDRVPMSLSESHRVVERILDGEAVTLPVDSDLSAREIVSLARDAGAICEQLDTAPAATTSADSTRERLPT